MKKTGQIVIISSITFLLFTIGFVQVVYSQQQGTLSINAGCATVVIANFMGFGTTDAGTGNFVQGNFTIRDGGNQAANISVENNTVASGDWLSGATTIIDTANTDYFTGDPVLVGGQLNGGNNLGQILADGTGVVLGVIQPNHLNPTNNDVVVDIETEAILTQAFAGALTLDILLDNTGCV